MSIDLRGAGVFLLTSDDAIAELDELAFATEDELQALVARHPRLIPAALSAGEPRRWILVGREQAIAETVDGAPRWSVDHLLLDQDGVPTLVEVKRSSDTRIRREVVGQMLDYAAAASVSWTSAQLRDHVEAVAPETVSELIGPEADVDSYWDAVEANLRAGRLRLVFLADRIPAELARVVEFLDAQMGLCEVRAVELRRFSEAGGTATIVTRPVAGARATHPAGSRPPLRQWDEASFLAELKELSGERAHQRMLQLIQWFRARGLRFWFGKGSVPSLFPILDLPDGRRIYPVAFWASGLVEVQFQRLQPPLDTHAARSEFADRLDRIPGVRIPRERLAGRPSFPLELVLEDAAAENLRQALQWCFDRSSETDPQP
jgi:hypothetical protein